MSVIFSIMATSEYYGKYVQVFRLGGQERIKQFYVIHVIVLSPKTTCIIVSIPICHHFCLYLQLLKKTETLHLLKCPWA